MLDEKIQSYKNELDIARKLANNESADQAYYNMIVGKLEKILKFYENLRIMSKDREE